MQTYPTSSGQGQEALFAAAAYLDDRWHRDVLLEWDPSGRLTRVTPGTAVSDAQNHPHCQVAAGPVIPGMPNLHSHAFQSAMAGLTEYRAQASDSFWSWRDLMYRYAAIITPDMMADIAQWLYINMLKAGYTSVCEFHYIHNQQDGTPYPNLPEMAARVVDAARQTGIGMTMLPVLYQYSNFGAQPPREDQNRFISNPERLLTLIDTLRQLYPEDRMLRYGVAPHSLRAVTVETLDELLKGLHRDSPDAPVHIHIAEQTAEVDACVARHGARPVQWLLDHHGVDARWCLVHATHIDASERSAMARSKAVAGLCLTTEANLGDGLFPAADYLAEGGRFGVGSDSHISVNWRSELRLMEYGQRLFTRQRNVLASAEQPVTAEYLFSRAVAGGGQATARPAGHLSAGQQADFLVLDADHPHLAGQAQNAWLSGVVFSEIGTNPIRDVFVGGQPVIQNRHHQDEERVTSRYRATLARLLAQD